MNSKLKKYYHKAWYSIILTVGKCVKSICTIYNFKYWNYDDLRHETYWWYYHTRENFDTHYSIPEIVRQVAPINGWVRDKTKKYCYFPGTLDPTGYFNPLGFCQLDIITYDVKRCREVEVQHRRVIILVTVDYSLVKVVKGPISITRPTNDQLQ